MKKLQASLVVVLAFVAFAFMACQQNQGKNNQGSGGQGSGGGQGGQGGGGGQGGSGGGGNSSNVTFNVQITELKPIKGNFTITPSDDNVTYAVGVMTKKKYEAEKAKGDAKKPTPLGIFAFDKSWYQLAAGTGGNWKEKAKELGYYKTGKTSDCFVGPEYIAIMDIRPETECVLYYYLIKETSDVPDSEIFTHEFKTPANTPSQNNLTANITKKYSNGVDVKITTTNSDTYAVYIARKRFLDWYIDGMGKAKGFTLTDAAYKLVADGMKYGLTVPVFTWDKELKPKDVLIPEVGAGKEYYLVYFVYDEENGVRYEVKKEAFTTGATPAP